MQKKLPFGKTSFRISRYMAIVILLLVILLLSSIYAIYQTGWPGKKRTGLQNKNGKEDLAYEMKHKNSAWFRSMNKPNADYFAVKKSFDNYFADHKWDESKCHEFGEVWIKKKIFYLDKNGIVQNPPPLYLSARASYRT